MAGYWFDIALVGALVLVNAVFAGSEMALVSLREGQLRQLEKKAGPRADRLVRLARDPNRFLATIQIGITLAGFLASATAAVSLAEPLVPSLGLLGSAAEPVAIASVTLVLTYFTLVLGELAPKRLAMQRPLSWAMLVARPLDVLSTLSRPVVAVLSLSSNGVVRLLGGRPDAEPEEISADELADLVSNQQVLDPDQRAIVGRALEIRRRTVREVLVPRGQVFRLAPGLTLDAAREALGQSGHSRAPVINRLDVDQVVGIVHWSAVMHGGQARVATVATPALLIPESVSVLTALRLFQAERQQLGVVVDEHGSIDGIVTVEDILEEIVGELYDETDLDVLTSEARPDGSMVIPGTFPLHDLPDLGVHLDHPVSGDYTTVAGLVLARLGRIPDSPGDEVLLEHGWVAEVVEVAHHAVTRVRLRRTPASAD